MKGFLIRFWALKNEWHKKGKGLKPITTFKTIRLVCYFLCSFALMQKNQNLKTYDHFAKDFVRYGVKIKFIGVLISRRSLRTF